MSEWLVYTDASGIETGETNRFIMDLAYGSSENDFKVTVPVDVELERRSYVYIPETAWGGYVNAAGSERSGGASVRIYEGPTWTGILDNRRISRQGGDDVELTVSGKVGDIFAGWLAETRLDAVFEVEAPDIEAEFSFYNNTRLYAAMCDLLDDNGLKMSFLRHNGSRTLIRVSPVEPADDDGELEGFGFKMMRRAPVNHLKCYGKDGETLHLYADDDGNVSGTQSLFGVDEIEDVYDRSSSEGDKFYEESVKKLKELQVLWDVDIDLPTGNRYDIGDRILVGDEITGNSGEAAIGKVIVSVDKYGVANVKYQSKK